jgi:type VI secretion system Hcp family effector
MALIRNLGSWQRAALALALATSAWGMGIAATPPAADAAYSIGPLVLNEGSANQIQVPSLLSFSFGITSGGSSKGWGTGGHAPQSTSEMTITKTLDAASPALLQAALTGKHYKTAGLTLQRSDSTFEAICLTDAFVSSAQAQAARGDEQPEEQISFVYDKLEIKYGAAAVSPPCGKPPPVESTLLGVEGRGSSVLARVDCLSPHCRGALTLSLPPAACPGGGPGCAFTGGVRVGLNGSGKVHFNGDGSATLNGGTRVGLNGAGKFSMGDGSVKIIRLGVPAPLRKWLNGHQHGVLGAIIVVRGQGTALVQHDELDQPAKLPPGAPSDSVEPPPGSGPVVDTPQSLSLASCTGAPPVGTPLTVVVVSGSLTPARSGTKVTLTYTPTSGPPPLPSPVVDTVTSDATGAFSENFDRQRGGLPYSWSVTASIPEGGGYSAAQSVACSIPVP